MDNNSNSTSSWPGAEDARRHLSILFCGPDAVVELRALGVRGVYGSGIVAGYFDNPEALIAAVAAVDGTAEGIYVTLNPVPPELLARAANHLIERPKQATTDNSIRRRRYLLIDVDPNRASGISATEDEKKYAFEVARNVREFLTSLGYPEPVRADSGNGAHLKYAIDLPAKDGGLVEQCLAALAFRFDTDHARVDQSVGNPARICKLYGTLARKGDSTADRPHRRSMILALPSPLITVPRAALEALAALSPKVTEARAVPPSVAGSRFDVDSYLSRHGIEVLRSSPWQRGQRWILKSCPFNAEHDRGEAFVVQFENGALSGGCQHDSCTWDWRSLRERLEPKSSRNTTTAGTSGTTSAGPFQFSEPEELPVALPPVMPFDYDLLPASFRPWIRDISERIQCPPDFAAVTAMIALATVVGRKIGICPKRRDDWLVVPNLFGALIGRPGIMKTPAIQEALRPLLRLDLAAKQAYDSAIRANEATKIVNDVQRKVAAGQIRDAIRKHEGDALDLANQIAAAADNEPKRKRYLVNDSTVEKLGEILRDNPNGVLCYRDELIGVLRSLEKDGQEGARSFYLEAWNGTGRYSFDRIGRGTIDIDAAIVSIVGGIQPGPFADYLIGAVSQGRSDDGLIQRFQLMVWPDTSPNWRNVDEVPDREAKDRAYAVFARLDTLDPVSLCPEWADAKPDSIPFLRFSSEAQEVFDRWREELEPQVRGGDEHPVIESHLAKYRSLIPSLALLIHLAEGFAGPVGIESLRRAIHWGRYLESHARRIYSIAVDPGAIAARTLSKRILRGDLKDGFALRDLYRKHWSGLSTPELGIVAVEILVDARWLVETTETTGGRPRTKYWINPRIHEMPRNRNAKSDKSPPVSPLAPHDEGGRETSNAETPPEASVKSVESADQQPPTAPQDEAAEGSSTSAAAPPKDEAPDRENVDPPYVDDLGADVEDDL